MKKIKIVGLLAISAIMLTGCIDAMPDMTAEQYDVVAEYAADLLLKYSPNYDYRLVSDDELAAALVQEAASEEALMSEAATEEESSEAATETKTEGQTNSEKEENEQSVEETEPAGLEIVDADTDLAVELGLEEEISLRYQSFEICDSYPQNFSGFSGIDAEQGRKLIVMHFDLENTAEEKVDCQLFDYSLKLRINVNQSLSTSVKDTSMLPDDMVSFIGSIEPGEKVDVIAVAEIEDMSDRDIESLTLQISSLNGSCNVKVR